jgi:hypothetical protein
MPVEICLGNIYYVRFRRRLSVQIVAWFGCLRGIPPPPVHRESPVDMRVGAIATAHWRIRSLLSMTCG